MKNKKVRESVKQTIRDIENFDKSVVLPEDFDPVVTIEKHLDSDGKSHIRVCIEY